MSLGINKNMLEKFEKLDFTQEEISFYIDLPSKIKNRYSSYLCVRIKNYGYDSCIMRPKEWYYSFIVSENLTSFADIAKKLGTTEKIVRATYYKAIEKLKNKLSIDLLY